MKSSAGGKGSSRRPSQTPMSVIDDNWDRIFGKKPSESKSSCGCSSGGVCAKTGGACSHHTDTGQKTM